MFQKIQLKNYPIFIGDCFAEAAELLQNERLIFIVDENTRRFCLPLFLEKTGLAASQSIIEIAPGEVHKNLETCQLIWQKLLEMQADRQAVIVCLGGGVVGDMGGFCAATWKRGLRFVQVPTTLLSMVDSSIGGKLGIDFQRVKNSIGVFGDPLAVFIYPDFLATLPVREVRSGFAEMVKHALISSPKQWRELQKLMPEKESDFSRLTSHLSHSLGVKKAIVARDPFENGIRKALNFGHTIGHAVESYFLETEKPLLHGEAVAVGMICESWISMKKTGLAERDFEKIRSFLTRVFGEIELPETAFPTLLETMRHDKKNVGGEIRFALLKKIGQPEIDVAVDEKLILESLKMALSH